MCGEAGFMGIFEEIPSKTASAGRIAPPAEALVKTFHEGDLIRSTYNKVLKDLKLQEEDRDIWTPPVEGKKKAKFALTSIGKQTSTAYAVLPEDSIRPVQR
jgi:hypothetical protein